MTTQEIYTQAKETNETQYDNLVNLFSIEEEKTLNILIKLGDSKELALWTVIAERYNKVDNSEFNYYAYNL